MFEQIGNGYTGHSLSFKNNKTHVPAVYFTCCTAIIFQTYPAILSPFVAPDSEFSYLPIVKCIMAKVGCV